MKFEEHSEGDFKYTFLFDDPDEIDAISAAHREHLYRQSAKQNSDKISGHEAYIAMWTRETNGPWISTNNPEPTIKILKKFHRRTNKAMRDLPEQSKVPPFTNMNLGWRYSLGQKALELANKMHDETNASQVIEEVVQIVKTGSSEASDTESTEAADS